MRILKVQDSRTFRYHFEGCALPEGLCGVSAQCPGAAWVLPADPDSGVRGRIRSSHKWISVTRDGRSASWRLLQENTLVESQPFNESDRIRNPATGRQYQIHPLPPPNHFSFSACPVCFSLNKVPPANPNSHIDIAWQPGVVLTYTKSWKPSPYQ